MQQLKFISLHDESNKGFLIQVKGQVIRFVARLSHAGLVQDCQDPPRLTRRLDLVRIRNGRGDTTCALTQQGLTV